MSRPSRPAAVRLHPITDIRVVKPDEVQPKKRAVRPIELGNLPIDVECTRLREGRIRQLDLKAQNDPRSRTNLSARRGLDSREAKTSISEPTKGGSVRLFLIKCSRISAIRDEGGSRDPSSGPAPHQDLTRRTGRDRMVSRNLGPGRSSTQTIRPDGPCGTTMTETSNSRKSLYYTATALSLSIGWGIRGNFGHEYGAMMPGRWRPWPPCSCRAARTGGGGSPTSRCSARSGGRSAAACLTCRSSPTRTRGIRLASSTASPACS